MKSLQELTKEALSQSGHDVIFEVKFDWLQNEWENKIEGYNNWLQCYEKVIYYTNKITKVSINSIQDINAHWNNNEFKGYYLLCGPSKNILKRIKSNTENIIVIDGGFDELPANNSTYEIIEYLGINNELGKCKIGADYLTTNQPYHIWFNESNKGIGDITNISFNYAGETEKWTLICVDDITGQFLVIGDQLGIKDDAYIDEQYDNGYISFKIQTDNNYPFKQGDIIYIYPAVSIYNDKGYIINSIDTTTGLIVEGGPDFLNWEVIDWEGENVSVMIRTYTDLFSDSYSNWVVVSKGDNLKEKISPRRYLQFLIILDGSGGNYGKIAKLSIKYDVKAHTNTSISNSYYDGFNRIKNIRIDKSATPQKEEGFAIADGNITLSNNDSYFSLDNEQSPYYNYLTADIYIKIRIGINEEFFPRFYGIIDGFDLSAIDGTVTTRFKGLGKKFNKKMIVSGDVSYRTWRNVSLSFLCNIISYDVKFNIEHLNIYNAIASSYVFEYVNLKDQNAWTVLQKLAQASLSYIYIDESGYLIIKDMFFTKTQITSPTSKIIEGDFVKFIYNYMFNSFLHLSFYKKDISLLYYYKNDYIPLLQNIMSGTLMYFDNDINYESFISFWAVDKQALYKISSYDEAPQSEKLINIVDYYFTSVMFSSDITEEESSNDSKVYAEKVYTLVRSINKDISTNKYEYILCKIDKNFNKYTDFLLGNLGRLQVNENGHLYFSYLLPREARSEITTTIFAVYADGSKTKLKYDNTYPYAETPSSWRFGQDKKHIIINKELSGVFYKIIYIPKLPFDYADSVTMNIDDKLILNNYENYPDGLYISKLAGVLHYKEDSNYHGHLFYVTVDDTTNRLSLYTTTGYGILLPNIIKKFIGVVYNEYYKAFIMVFKDTNNNYRIAWVSLLNSSNNNFNNPDYIYVNGIVDTNLIIYDIEYNREDKQTYISGGYKNGNKIKARLFIYSITNINITFENLAGKPISRVYPKDSSNINDIVSKDYYFYFQKRGGFKAVTSQIWAWSRYIRDEEDKDKCIIKQKKEISPTIPDGNVKDFDIPISMSINDIRYVYINGKNIGSNNWIKATNRIRLLYAPQPTDIIEFGEGKQIYKYYGLFIKFDDSYSTNGNVSWNDTTGGWTSFQIYKAVKLKISFKNCNLSSGNTITINGINGINENIIETITFGNNNYTSIVNGSGNITKDLTQDENNNYFIETESDFKFVDSIQAGDLWNNESSLFQVESILMDLIDNIIIEIYTSANEQDEQFGGDGTVSGYTDKVYIKVEKQEGLKEINDFSQELAFHSLNYIGNSIIGGMIYPSGKTFFYSKNKNIVPIIPDYKLDYDKNITKLSYNISDSEVKNKIIIKAEKNETEDYREYDDDGTYIGGDIIPQGYTEDQWLWARLYTVWKTQAPFYLMKGDFIEFNVNFKTPVYNGGYDTNIKFNAHYYQIIGRLDDLGNWKDNDVESYFPDLKLNNTQYILMAGKYNNSSSKWEINNNPNIDILFTPFDNTVHIVSAKYPSRFYDDNGDGQPDDFTGSNPPDLTNGIDIVTTGINNHPYIQIQLDNNSNLDREINVLSRHDNSSNILLAQEIIDAINSVFVDYGTIASIKYDYFAGNKRIYIELKSLSNTTVSQIHFKNPSDNNWTATTEIFGITSDYIRNAISTTIGEMEKNNCEVYIQDNQVKLSYEAGEYNILKNGNYYVLELSTEIRNTYGNKLVSFYYPLRLDINRKDIDQTYNKQYNVLGSGDIKRFYYDENGTLPRLLYSYDIVGNKYKLIVPVGGFHLSMLWKNTSILENTNYLRIENATNNKLDANYSPEIQASGLDVWLEKIELRGLRIYTSPVELTTISDLKSQKRFLKQEITIDNKFIQDINIGYLIGSYLLKKYAFPMPNVNIDIIGIPILELLDILWIREKTSGIYGQLFEIVSMSENLSDGSPYIMTLKLDKIPNEYQPKYNNKFLYYNGLSINYQINN